MFNAYLENLYEAIKLGDEVENGARALVSCYNRAKKDGFEVLTWDEVMWEDDTKSIVETLEAAGIHDLYITSQASNMLSVYLLLDTLGLKLRGVVNLENPKYKKEMDAWGSSFEPKHIPAMKLSF